MRSWAAVAGAFSLMWVGGIQAHAGQRRAARAICGPTRADLVTIRQTTDIRVIERVSDPDGYGPRKFLCRRGHCAVWSLNTDPTYVYATLTGRIAGPFLLVREDSGAGPGDNATDIQIVDTRTGRYATTAVASPGIRSYAQLQITDEGNAVWLDRRDGPGGATSTVMALGRHGLPIALDAGTAAGHLKLRGRHVTWTQAGTPRSFDLGSTPRYRLRLDRVHFSGRPPR